MVENIERVGAHGQAACLSESAKGKRAAERQIDIEEARSGECVTRHGAVVFGPGERIGAEQALPSIDVRYLRRLLAQHGIGSDEKRKSGAKDGELRALP